ncbi:MAG TPA: ABC transporter substrate-binding protein [Vicinamibacterales bacterium]|nr:ABC transporter substrate-binding protein [Vicinamibacterales bacterium]
MTRTQRWRVGIAGAALLAAAAALACGRSGRSGPSARPLTPVRMAVGGQGQLIYLPATLAGRLGYYRQEGLDVRIDDFAGGAQALEALMGGSTDVVSGFYDHTIQLAADGRHLTAFVTMLRYPGLALAVSPKPSRPITDIRDLVGRRVGITAPGSSSQMLVQYLLSRRGLPASSVSFVGIGTGATAIAALQYGRVDAGIVTEPALTQLEQRTGPVRLLADLRTAAGVQEAFGTSAYPASVLYAQTGWIAAHQDTVQRLTRALVRTLGWMQHHTPQEIAARMPASYRGGDTTLYVNALTHLMPIFSPDGLMPADGARAVETLLAFALPKVRQAHVDLSATYTNRFVTAAAAPAAAGH